MAKIFGRIKLSLGGSYKAQFPVETSKLALAPALLDTAPNLANVISLLPSALTPPAAASKSHHYLQTSSLY